MAREGFFLVLPLMRIMAPRFFMSAVKADKTLRAWDVLDRIENILLVGFLNPMPRLSPFFVRGSFMFFILSMWRVYDEIIAMSRVKLSPFRAFIG